MWNSTKHHVTEVITFVLSDTIWSGLGKIFHR